MLLNSRNLHKLLLRLMISDFIGVSFLSTSTSKAANENPGHSSTSQPSVCALGLGAHPVAPFQVHMGELDPRMTEILGRFYPGAQAWKLGQGGEGFAFRARLPGDHPEIQVIKLFREKHNAVSVLMGLSSSDGPTIAEKQGMCFERFEKFLARRPPAAPKMFRVAHLLAIGEDKGSLYLDDIRGQNLDRLLSDQSLPLEFRRQLANSFLERKRNLFEAARAADPHAIIELISTFDPHGVIVPETNHFSYPDLGLKLDIEIVSFKDPQNGNRQISFTTKPNNFIVTPETLEMTLNDTN